MNPSEAAELLATLAAFDQRTVGRADALAWSATLPHISLTDAREAAIWHYQRNRDRMMPSDVINGVRRIRNERIQAAGDPPPDADPNQPADYLAALRANRTLVADGTHNTVGQARVAAAIQTVKPPRPPGSDRHEMPLRARKATVELARREQHDAAQRRREAKEHTEAEHRARLEQARAELDALRAEVPAGVTATSSETTEEDA